MPDGGAPVPPDGAAARPRVSAARRLRYLLPALLFAAVAAALGAQLFTGEPGRLPSALLDKPAPDFDLPPVHGFARGFATADLRRGEVALVNVFASWCGPCRIEHPLFMELAGTVPLYGLNYKDAPRDAGRWLRRHGNPYTATGADEDGRVAIDWGVYGVPETFVVDGAGRIRHRHIGVLTRHDLDETILPLIEALRR